MNALLAKINNIPMPTTELSDADAKALELLRLHYESEREELYDAQGTIEDLKTNSENPWLNDQLETVLENAEEAQQQARDTHASQILQHFNTTYSLQLQRPYAWDDTLKAIPPQQLTDFVYNWVLKQLGGRSFFEHATAQLAKDLQARVWRATMNRRHVTLLNFVSVRDNYRGGVQLEWASRHQLQLIARALTRYCTRQTSNTTELTRTLHNLEFDPQSETVFGQKIPTNLNKAPEFVIYKNGNLRITFATETDASAFISLYNLKLKE